LRKISRQLSGPDAFTHRDVVAALVLRRDQQEKIRTIIAESKDWRHGGGPPPGRGPGSGGSKGGSPTIAPTSRPEGAAGGEDDGRPERPGGPPPEMRMNQRPDQRAQEAVNQILAELAPFQVEKWKELIGKPFNASAPQRGFGGPPGDRR
jgi:hypothetical protein